MDYYINGTESVLNGLYFGIMIRLSLTLLVVVSVILKISLFLYDKN